MKIKKILSLSLVIISISLSFVGCSKQSDKSNDIQNSVDKTNSTEKSNTDKENKISSSEAKNIVNDKFKNIVDSDSLLIGGDFFNLTDVIGIENQNYYVFYFKNKDQSIKTDKRVLVNATTGEIYGNYNSNKNKLIPIDNFINDLSKDKSNLINFRMY
ncbi:putative lipoprotein [[Clostridium] sordellii ATCC 9714]|nr:putative lipoprotein [[Clostridium] sordellii ATCC 9714] [Paeniclostridium sordellii ATCC 9714]